MGASKGDITKSMPLISKVKGKEGEKIEEKEEEDKKPLIDFLAMDYKRAMKEVSISLKCGHPCT